MTTEFGTRHWNAYTRIENSQIDGRVYYDCYDISGLMKYMRGHDEAVAIFGQFEVAYSEEPQPRKIVRWTVYLGTDKEREMYGIENWIACHECSNGEFWDDLVALRNGNVEYVK